MGKIKQPEQTNTKIIKEHGDASKGGLAPVELVVTEEVVGKPDGDELNREALKLVSIKRFFDVDITDTSNDKKLKEIQEWGKEKGLESDSELFTELEMIKRKLGVGNGSLNRVYQWIRIEEKVQRLLGKQRSIQDDR